MLKDYLKSFKKWAYSTKLNRDDILAGEKFFFSLCKGYDQLKRITKIEYYYAIIYRALIMLLYILKRMTLK